MLHPSVLVCDDGNQRHLCYTSLTANVSRMKEQVTHGADKFHKTKQKEMKNYSPVNVILESWKKPVGAAIKES